MERYTILLLSPMTGNTWNQEYFPEKPQPGPKKYLLYDKSRFKEG